MVTGIILLALMFPGTIVISYVVTNEKIMDIIFYTILLAFFVIGVLFVVLMFVFGGLKQKQTKADKFPLRHKNYDDFEQFLLETLLNKGYLEYCPAESSMNEMLKVYIRTLKIWQIDCVTIIHIKELTDETIQIINDSITKIMLQYYGRNMITETINMISFFCVERITPSFRKLINGNLQQGIKNGRLNVGVSFGGKQMYIANQIDGFAINRYKRLRKQLFEIIKQSPKQKIV